MRGPSEGGMRLEPLGVLSGGSVAVAMLMLGSWRMTGPFIAAGAVLMIAVPLLARWREDPWWSWLDGLGGMMLAANLFAWGWLAFLADQTPEDDVWMLAPPLLAAVVIMAAACGRGVER